MKCKIAWQNKLVDTTRPAGSASVKLTVSATVAFGFVMVKLRLLLPPTGIANKPKLLVVTGGATTVILAEAVFPNPPSIEGGREPCRPSGLLRPAPSASAVP